MPSSSLPCRSTTENINSTLEFLSHYDMISVIEEERERVHAELMNIKSRISAASGSQGPDGAAVGPVQQPPKHFLFDAPPTADCKGLAELFRDDYVRVAEEAPEEDIDASSSPDYARRVQECLSKIELDLTDIIGWSEPTGSGVEEEDRAGARPPGASANSSNAPMPTESKISTVSTFLTSCTS